ncbi:MAG: hypothetical protein HY326_10830 [Chloroflexi bacterium]|nr:hypothetical protein [Chloroflexota bacterium]
MIKNSFDKGPESWYSYDYHASIVSGGYNIFKMVTFRRQGGVNDSGYVWTDHLRWSADTPESPLSILPLLTYRSWINADPIDLRGAQVSVYLRGDNLNLNGAKCYFWVHSGGTRWHYHGNPLTISERRWSDEPLRFTLRNDASLWHNSWSHIPNNPMPLDQLLSQAVSYGFSFAGFGSEVSGRLSMDEFEIQPA